MTVLKWLSQVVNDAAGDRARIRKRTADVGRQASRLEARLCLSGNSVYASASAAWFGSTDLEVAAADGGSGVSGASANDSNVSASDVRHFLVRLSPEATAIAKSPAGARNMLAAPEVDFQVVAGLGLPGQILVATSERDSVQIVQALQSNQAVAYFEEDFSVGATAFPSEQTESPLWVRQWGLHNTGQTGGVADVDIDAPEAWDLSVGDVGTVATLIDSGIDYTHPDLYLNIWLNQGELADVVRAAPGTYDVDADGLITFRDLNDPSNSSIVSDRNQNGYIDAGDLLNDPDWADGIDTDNNGFVDDLIGWDFFENDNDPFDQHRHGTHVAGILGGVGNNDVGIAGVNWQLSMMPLRFLDQDNNGDISDAVEAINYSTMMRTRDEAAANIRVSNNSWGSSTSFSQSLFDAVAGNRDADILFVAAAGNGDVLGQGVNNDQTGFYPANLELDNVISVGALNNRGQLAPFSNYGPDSVDIAAPGVDIISSEPGGTYIARSGTSMATPHVAGAAALVFERFASATAIEVKDALLSGADVRAALQGLVDDGRSLNAFHALTASTFAPVPELQPIAAITTPGGTSLSLTVSYQDQDGGTVDTTAFDSRDVEIQRNGFSQTLLNPVTVTSTTISGLPAATYEFAVPGGSWDASENGTWTVHLREGEIRDSQNLYTAPRVLGTVQVQINDPNVLFVNTTGDTVDADPGDGQPADANGDVSLRAAIMHANAAAADTTIVVPDGIYTLVQPGRDEDAAATGDLDLTSPHTLTIIGAGALSTVIDAQQLDRVFDVSAGATAAIHGIVIRSGTADSGGGVRNAGTLTLQESLVADNTAEIQGGGISSTGTLTVIDSSIESNLVTSRFFGFGGGGVFAQGPTTVTGSSIVYNTSATTGGGVLAFQNGIELDHVTIAQNTAERGDGGGLLLREVTGASLHSTTIIQNTALDGSGGGLNHVNAGGTVSVDNTIVAENVAGTTADVEGRITSAGNNLFGQPSDTESTWRRLGDSVADFDQIGTRQSPLLPGLGPLKKLNGLVHVAEPVADGPASNSDIAGVAVPALTPGMPIVYSTVELEPNNSRGQAMRLDDRGWSLDEDPNIENSTTVPHVTISGTGDGTFDYFSFTVSVPNTTAVFDIDNGSLPTNETFDTELFLFDSSDNLLASNDDDGTDAGSSSSLDSRIEYTFLQPGYYTIAVGAWDSFHDGGGRLAGNELAVDTRYDLNISVDHHLLAPTSYEPSSTADELFPVAGTGMETAYFMSAVRSQSRSPSPYQLSIAADPETVVIGDVNGDGKMDLVLNSQSQTGVYSLIGNEAESLSEIRHSGAGYFFSGMVLEDVSGDGIPDIVVILDLSDDLGIMIGNGDGTFQTPQRFPTGSSVNSVAVGDISGDGIPDLVATNLEEGQVRVLRGNGNGTFQVEQSFQVGRRPFSVALGDADGDAIADIVTANRDSDDVSLLRGNGNGAFQSVQHFPVGDGVHSVVLGDVNGDGINDIVTTNSSSDRVSVLRATATGTFAPAEHFDTGRFPTAVDLLDVNDDSFVDIVTLNSNDVSVLRGNGDGSFQSPRRFAIGENPRSMALGDLDGDGNCDVIVTNVFSGAVTVLGGNDDGTFRSVEYIAADGESVVLGDVNSDGINDVVTTKGTDGVRIRLGIGNGTFQPPQLVAVGDFPQSAVIGDVTGDGIIDIVTANNGSNNVSVLRGAGDGSFAPANNFPVGSSPSSAILGDVNGDGIIDIVTANNGSNNVTVLRGESDGNFMPPQHVDVGDSPEWVALSDVNRDGIKDIVTANSGSDSVSVLLGRGGEDFQPIREFRVGDYPRSVVVVDVNGDGNEDIIVANYGSRTVSMLRGFGDGTFQSAEHFAAGSRVGSLVAGDVTGDGILDIVTAGGVLEGTGHGDFEPVEPIVGGPRPESVAIGDVNGDGVRDIVTTDFATKNVGILLNATPIFDTVIPTLDRLQSLPVHENPLVYASSGAFVYWITVGSSLRQTGIEHFAVWAYSTETGVRRVSLFDAASDLARPTRLVATDSTLVIESRDSPRVLSQLTGTELAENHGNGTFGPATHFPTGNDPYSVVMGDVNGDLWTDLITANYEDDTVSVLLGIGDGTFQRPSDFPVGQFPLAVQLGDVSGDGIADIVTANFITQNVSVLHGMGDGGFQPNTVIDLDNYPSTMVLGDVTGDGIFDIVTGSGGTVNIIESNGDGTFQARRDIDVVVAPESVAIGDVTGDSQADIVLAYSGGVYVLQSIGDGTFQESSRLIVGEFPHSLVLGDVNGDSITDIVTANGGSHDVSVIRATGTGSFEAAVNFPTGVVPTSANLGDVNGDGITDIVTANSFTDNVSVLLGSGNGTFRSPSQFPSGLRPRSVVLGDVNGDGTVDIVTVNAGSDNVSVLHGDPSFLSVVDLPSALVVGSVTQLRAKQHAAMDLQRLPIGDVASNAGLLRYPGYYEFVRMERLEESILVTIRLTDATTESGEIQLLLIDAPKFGVDGNAIASAVENLTLNSSLRVTAAEEQQLFVNGDRIYLTGEVVGSGFGDELLVFDRTNGLRLVADLLPGPDSSKARDFVAVGDDVYFTALASRIDNQTQQPVLRRELFVLDPTNNLIRAVRAGQEVTGGPSLVGSTLFFHGPQSAGEPALLWAYDTTQEGVPSLGAFQPIAGSVSGTTFLDSNGDGRRNDDEPGRAGVTVYVDLNDNGRRESSEPAVVSQTDDPATATDDAGRYTFTDLPGGDYTLREVPEFGFDQTTPLTISAAPPVLNEFSDGSDTNLGLPSIVGDNVVYVDVASGDLILKDGQKPDVSLLSLRSMLPDNSQVVSLGASHAQDGSTVVVTVTLDDGRELIVTSDANGRLKVLADTGTPITTAAPGQPTGSTTLDDIEDLRNRGFDSLSISDGNVGFLADTSTGLQRYYLGDGIRFGEFQHAQVLLDGSNEVFVDRVVDGTGEILSGDDLFLDKATLDDNVQGNTGWQITTRSGDVILPLSFFDRILDVAVSGNSAVFRASNAIVSDGLYLATFGGNATLLTSVGDLNPEGTLEISQLGSLTDNMESPSVATDGERIVFVAGLGSAPAQQVGLYAWINGSLRTIVDSNTDFGGRTLADIHIGHQAMSGNRMVFLASFSDGTESVFQAVIPAEAAATVSVRPGETVSSVDFGASAQPGTIQGMSFTDVNLNGVFDRGEPGNPGRTVFLDENSNGLLDSSERSVVTNADGTFRLSDLTAETTYVLRENLPVGISATTLKTLADATVFVSAAATVEFNTGSVATDVLGESTDGVVAGVVFDDFNANGTQDGIEPGINGIRVYVDKNRDGVLNGGERSVLTGTDGTYRIEGLQGNKHTVRVVLPDEREQITPLGNAFTTSALNTTDSPVEVIAGDFNGDGIIDLATTIDRVSEVRFFVNDGSGAFTFSRNEVLASGPGSLAIGRFSGLPEADGLVVGHRTSNFVKVLLPRSDGSFTVKDLITPAIATAQGLGNAPYSVTSGNFTGDQQDDVAVVSQSSGIVSLFRNNGDDTFSLEQVLPLPPTTADFATAITAGHVDAGATVDLVVAASVTKNLVVLANSGISGNNRFSLAQNLSLGGNGGATLTSVQVGDLDDDGDNEIVTANLLSDQIFIFRNNGDGTFQSADTHAAGKGPAHLRIVDLDGNGSLDLAFANSDAQNRFGILRNRGDGSFRAAETSGLANFQDGTLAFSMTIAHFDENDTPDVAVSNRYNGDLGGVVGGLTVGLNSVVPGGIPVDLIPTQPTATGLNFGLRTQNRPPSLNDISDLIPIDEDAGEQIVLVSGINSGGEAEPLQVSVSSSNTSLINPTIVFDASSGTATIRYTPVAERSGSAEITVSLRDPGYNGIAGDSDDGMAAETFLVTVNPVNDDPTMSTPQDLILDEDASQQTISLNGISAGPDEPQPLHLSVSSNAPSLISSPQLTYASPNATGTLTFTPVANASGVATVTVRLEDGGLDNDLNTLADNGTSEISFRVTVNPTNDLPTLNAIGAVEYTANSLRQFVLLSGISSGPGESQALQITASSSNNSLLTVVNSPISQTAIVSGSTQLELVRVPGVSGTSLVTVRVEDGGLDDNLGTSIDNGIFDASFTVTVNPDSNPQFLVVPVTSLSVPEGGTSMFAIKLAAQPISNVTVRVDRTSGDTNLRVSGASTLVFTPANWNTSQQVTLAADEDQNAADSAAVFSVTSSGLIAVEVTANEADNDVQALIVSSTNVTVSEGGTNTLAVQLAAQPLNNVTVHVARTSGDADLILMGASTLTFTPVNWNSPQMVTLAAQEDADASDGTAIVTLSSTGLPSVVTSVAEADNDIQSLMVSLTSMTLSEGGSDTFTVHLAAQPLGDVTVNTARTSGDTSLSVAAGGTLIFTPANWNTPRQVTLAAEEDDDAINNSGIFTVSSPELTSVNVTVTEADNDTQALVVSSNSVTVIEGSANTFSVKLAAQPGNNLTVSVAHVSGDADLQLSGGATLTFTTANWDVPQMVVVSAAEDTDATNGSAVFRVSLVGHTPVEVTATEADNESQSLVVSPSNLTVNEGSTGTVSVQLAAEPPGPLNVTAVRTSGDSSLSITAGATLQFGPANWNMPQLVTLAAAEDADLSNGSAVFTFSSASLSSVNIAVTEDDNDTAGITVSESSLNVNESGTTATFSLRLNAEPTANVVLDIAVGDNTEVGVSPVAVTFTAASWDSPQIVTVVGVDDSAADGDQTSTVTIAVNTASSDDEFDSVAAQVVTVTTADNDVFTSLPGDIDGDSDFDANDAFLISLVKLSGTDAQIDQSRGTSPLSAAEIRSRINQLSADVDGDSDTDANDAFLIQLVKLSGTDAQLDQSKGASQLTAAQIRTNVNAMGEIQTRASSRSAITADVAMQSVSPGETTNPSAGLPPSRRSARLFRQPEHVALTQLPVAPAESVETFDQMMMGTSFREWIDAI